MRRSKCEFSILFLLAMAFCRAQTPPAFSTAAGADVLVDEGAALSIAVGLVGGRLPFLVRWRKDGVEVAATTATNLAATYSIPAARATDSGTWHVEASNAAGTATSHPRGVVVRPAVPPKIRTHPSERAILS